MRGKNNNPLAFSIEPQKIFHSPRPNLLTCGIEQRVYCTDLLPDTNTYRCSNEAHEIFLDRCVLDFVIVPQGLIFSWLQQFTCLWWQCGAFRRAQSFESLRLIVLLCCRITVAKTRCIFSSVSFYGRV